MCLFGGWSFSLLFLRQRRVSSNRMRRRHLSSVRLPVLKRFFLGPRSSCSFAALGGAFLVFECVIRMKNTFFPLAASNYSLSMTQRAMQQSLSSYQTRITFVASLNDIFPRRPCSAPSWFHQSITPFALAPQQAITNTLCLHVNIHLVAQPDERQGWVFWHTVQ